MSIEIRTVRPDELEAYMDASTTAFLERPDVAKVAASVAPHWDLTRVWAAFDGPRIVASFRSFATELTVPGGRQIAASAIAGVGVLPTHRRRGILRRLMDTEHKAMPERGELVSLLNASEYPIYGRFGYGMGCRVAVWKLHTRATGFHGSATGSVELVAPGDAALAMVMGVFDEARQTRVGEIRRREIVWRFQLGLEPDPWDTPWKGFLVVHRDDAGRVDGFARYHAEDKWVDHQPGTILHIDDLQALDDQAEAELWRFLASVDWVATLRAERRGPGERLPWLLTNHRAAVVEELVDGMFVRLHDVSAALEARTYDGEGSVVLEIADPGSQERPARVLLEAGPDGARCRATDRTPDLTVHLAALSAAYLGGTPLSRVAIAFGGADEGTPGAMARVERLFRTLDEPWCSTFF